MIRALSFSPDRRQPFHLLLLLAGTVFVVTAFAYAVLPVLEEQAVESGEPQPPSAFREAIKVHGWKWLLAELAVVIALSVASMLFDDRRTLQKPTIDATIPTSSSPTTPKQPDP